nr:hypothetical protein [Tanacetum cinerariifolium]
KLKEYYHSIKDDIPLVSVYTTGNVIVQGKLISDAFLTDHIRVTEEYKEYEKVIVGVYVPTVQPQPVEFTQGTIRTPGAHMTPTPTTIVGDVFQKKRKRKQVAEETSSPKPSLKIRVKQNKLSTTPIPPPSDDKERDEIAEATQMSLALHKTAKIAEEQENVAIVQNKLMYEDIEKIVDEPGSHKEHLKTIDDDENEKEKKDDKKDDVNDDHADHTLDKTQEMGSLETRKEKIQTPIPSPHRSPKTNLS